MTFYNKALTASQVKAIYQAGLPAPYYYHTVTQAAAKPALTPSKVTMAAAGGSSSVSVSIPEGVNWTAKANHSWITVTSGASGTGAGTVNFTVASNPAVTSRTGTLTIAGVTLQVVQSGLAAAVSYDGTVFKAAGGSANVYVTAEGNGTWTATSNVDWITVALGASGAGNGTVTFVVNPYDSPLEVRTGKLTIAGKTVTVTQRGYEMSITPTAADVPANSGSATIAVSAPNGAIWEAITSASWITITGGQSGTGSGQVTYSVAANTTGAVRTGTITIAGEVCQVKQAGGTVRTLTYTNLKGATHSNPSSYTEGSAITFSNPSAVTGYTFAGWSPSAITTSTKGNQTITANWTANTYTVKFNANGGTGTLADEAFTYDTAKALTANAFTREGYAFTGWATSASGAVVYADKASVKNLTATKNGTVTLYAKWSVVLDPPTISGVTARQRYPWNGKVDLSFTVTGNTAGYQSQGLVPALKVTATDETTGRVYTARSLEGATEMTAGTHRVIWDMAADGLTFISPSVRFTVACEMKIARYCVVDLAAGATAVSYPVSYLTEEPVGGFTNDLYRTTKLALRWIGPGSFIMGEDQTDESHRVTLTQPYYMGVFEMTQKQWELVMGTNPCADTAYGKGDAYPVHYVSYEMIRGSSNGAQWPASSGVDAASFLGKLQARTKLTFDLPTEAQWEYACRAGTTTAYYWGSSMNGDYAWCSSNSESTTHPVGTKKPNAWGLYDMLGNVWEWCLDWNGTLAYGMDPKGPSSGANRVRRSGSRCGGESVCTSYNRSSRGSSFISDDNGFRLACVQGTSGNEGVVGEASSAAIRIDLSPSPRTAAALEMLAYSTEYSWLSPTPEGFECLINGDFEQSHISANDGVWGKNNGVMAVIEKWYSPAGGVTRAESPWTTGGDLPIGEFAAYLQRDASMQQTFVAPVFGTYEFSFVSCARASKDLGHMFSVSIDGTELLEVVSNSGVGETHSKSLQLSAGSHTLQFTGVRQDGLDQSSVIDNVSLVLKKASDDVQCVISAMPVSAENARFMVIDLSGGPTATDYPVSYLDAVPAEGWTDEYKKTKLVMRRVEAGENPAGGRMAHDMYVAVFETTQKQLELIAPDKCNFSSYSRGDTHPADSISSNMLRGKSACLQLSSLEVEPESVVGRLRARTGVVTLDLPTLDEWMYACRAGVTTVYNNGTDDEAGLALVARYQGNRMDGVGDGCTNHVPVGCYAPNAWGLYDMHGNVMELCRAVQSDGIGTNRQWICGGGYSNSDCKVTSRPAANTLGFGASYCGFRLVCVADTVQTGISETVVESKGRGTVDWTPTRAGTYFLTHSVPGVDDEMTWFSVPGPTLTLASNGSIVSGEAAVTIDGAEGWTVYYTTDGSEPTMASASYTGAIVLKESTTVKAVAYSVTGIASQIVSQYYEVVAPEPVEVADPVITPANGSVFTGESCMVTIACATTGANIYYSTNGSTPRTSASYLYGGPFTITGTTTVKAVAVKDSLKSAYVTAVITKETLSLPRALDLPADSTVALTTGGDAEWNPVVDSTAKVGASSAQSGAIGMMSESWLEARVSGAGTFAFWWRTDCEWDDSGDATWDHLAVFVNGEESARIDGTTAWARLSFDLPAGENVIRWVYTKDDFDEEGAAVDDCAWVDGIEWTPSAVAVDPVPAVGASATAAEVAAALAGSADARLSEKLTTAAKYNAYRAWVDKVAGTDLAARQAVKDAPQAWLSYALDLAQVLETAPNAVTIEAAEATATAGRYALTVAVDGVTVGAGATVANLAEVFGVTGAATLDGTFSAANVTFSFEAPKDGKVKIVAGPKDVKAARFFLRATMRK